MLADEKLDVTICWCPSKTVRAAGEGGHSDMDLLKGAQRRLQK